MFRRTALVPALLALLVASCDQAETEPTDTTEPEETTTTTTAPPIVGRASLQANDPPIVREGDRGPLVEALQFYLVCVGLESPDPDGPLVTVDGSYGPITAFAVAYYQAQLRRAPSGEPDDATFAAMARECDQSRELAFPPGEAATQVAGNAAPGDDEVFTFDGQPGQVLRLTAVEGGVQIAIEDADGGIVAEGSGSAEAELPAARRYTVRVTASVPTTFLITAEVRSPNVLVSEFGPMVLRGNGIGIAGADFGADADNARAVMSLIFGAAYTDSEWRSDVSACPGTHRVTTWLVQAASGSEQHPALFVAFFAEVGNERVFVEYRYHSRDVASVDPLAQGLATTEGISIGSTLARFSEAYGTPTIGPQGTVTVDPGIVMTFAVVGDADPDASRVRSIAAGSGGCRDLE